MIAPLRTSSHDCSAKYVHEKFLELLPQIRKQALFAFRGLRAEAREEMIEEVVANAYCAFSQLVRQGKVTLAYATPLAQYAVRQVRAGRRVGNRLQAHDLLSPSATQIQRLTVKRLDRRDDRTGAWTQLLVEDRHAGPAETAAARIDVAAWFRGLSQRNQQIAKALALGEPTGGVARQFGLSPGRISQLRIGFRRSWERFQTNSGGRSVAI
jgi:hypothetical protein